MFAQLAHTFGLDESMVRWIFVLLIMGLICYIASGLDKIGTDEDPLRDYQDQ